MAERGGRYCRLRPGAAAAALLGVLVLAPSASPGGVRADGPDRAGLVVRFEDGRVIEACVSLDGARTGEELLRLAGLDVDAESGPLGSKVCSIDGEGCPRDNCWCRCRQPGDDCRYWAYHVLEGDRWRYSAKGASSRAVRPGDVDGWAWGSGTYGSGATPPVRTFAQLCGPSDAPTNPASTPDGGDAAPPTSGSAPSAEPAPVTAAAPTRTPRPSRTPTEDHVAPAGAALTGATLAADTHRARAPDVATLTETARVAATQVAATRAAAVRAAKTQLAQLGDLSALGVPASDPAWSAGGRSAVGPASSGLGSADAATSEGSLTAAHVDSSAAPSATVLAIVRLDPAADLRAPVPSSHGTEPIVGYLALAFVLLVLGSGAWILRRGRA